MLRWLVAGGIAFGLLTTSQAMAQHVDGHGVPFREWDIQAGLGLHVISASDRGVGNRSDWYEQWHPAAAGTLELGRYWTSHLKTEVGLNFLTSHVDGSQQTIVVPNGQTAYAFVQSRVRQTQFLFAGTHQFGENEFAHPYVTLGARVGLLDVHASRSLTAYASASSTPQYYTLPPLETDTTSVLVRPYVAFGSKSYFSDRAFVRPEVMLAFNRRGLGQYSLRLAFGADF